MLTLVAKRDRLSHPDLCKRVKDDGGAERYLKTAADVQSTPGIKECVASTSTLESVTRIVPFYTVPVSEE